MWNKMTEVLSEFIILPKLVWSTKESQGTGMDHRLFAMFFIS